MVDTYQNINRIHAGDKKISASNFNKIVEAVKRSLVGTSGIAITQTGSKLQLSLADEFTNVHWWTGSIDSTSSDYDDNHYAVKRTVLSSSDTSDLTFTQRSAPYDDIEVVSNLAEAANETHLLSDTRDVIVYEMKDDSFPPISRYVMTESPVSSDISELLSDLKVEYCLPDNIDTEIFTSFLTVTVTDKDGGTISSEGINVLLDASRNFHNTTLYNWASDIILSFVRFDETVNLGAGGEGGTDVDGVLIGFPPQTKVVRYGKIKSTPADSVSITLDKTDKSGTLLTGDLAGSDAVYIRTDQVLAEVTKYGWNTGDILMYVEADDDGIASGVLVGHKPPLVVKGDGIWTSNTLNAASDTVISHLEPNSDTTGYYFELHTNTSSGGTFFNGSAKDASPGGCVSVRLDIKGHMFAWSFDDSAGGGTYSNWPTGATDWPTG